MTKKVLDRAGLDIGDIDAFEVNEAFTPVVPTWQVETGADLGKVNVNRGAIAIGHPLGASGARLTTTLLNALEQREGRFGLQVMCEAGGLANATIIERIRAHALTPPSLHRRLGAPATAGSYGKRAHTPRLQGSPIGTPMRTGCDQCGRWGQSRACRRDRFTLGHRHPSCGAASPGETGSGRRVGHTC
ncbi:hypothetical protein GCM10023094_34730 [Rhodococcus olei]|uniref:Thiolase C-terminal domain-containing protein n=1 Tax=Rhodococcus olei TaxID=2161675 RepID=A0ABP8PAZ5_9NOCA